MTEVSFFDLIVRMVVSLGVVLGLMFGAYWFLRRRQGFGPATGLRVPRRSAGSRSLLGLLGGSAGGSTGGAGAPRGAARGGAGRVAGNRRGLRVVGRVGVGRTTQLVAVQFADRVYLLGASDTSAPTVLADLDLAAWTVATESPDEDLMPLIRDSGDVRSPMGGSTPRPTSLIESLREATTRRG